MAVCKYCEGSELVILGLIGNIWWYRCRSCGADQQVGDKPRRVVGVHA